MYNAQGKIRQRDLFDEHLPLVRRQALNLQVRPPASVELDDLIQAGMIGLLDAVNRNDAGQGASFATFARQRIRGAMLDELRSRAACGAIRGSSTRRSAVSSSSLVAPRKNARSPPPSG